MVAHNGVIRIFWPSNASKTYLSGVLVGFKNSEYDLFVVAMLLEVERRHIENALIMGTLLRHSSQNSLELLQRCGHSSLCVLGTVNPRLPLNNNEEKQIIAHISKSSHIPTITHCQSTIKFTQVIVYDPPHPARMQHLSLQPILLALEDHTQAAHLYSTSPALKRAEEVEREQKTRLVQKLKLHKVISHSSTQQNLALPKLIEQVNCSHELNMLLEKNLRSVVNRTRRSLSVSEQVAESANNLWDYVYLVVAYALKIWLWPVIARISIVGLMGYRFMAEAVLIVLHWQADSSSSQGLLDLSATAQQIDIRLQQSCFWPIQYITLRKRKATWKSFTNSHPEYIRFYNSLWLVANDIIMGVALASFILDNADLVVSRFETIFSIWSIQVLREMIAWLMHSPGGLKLNTELAAFLGDLFLWVIDCWADCLASLQPHLTLLIHILGYSAYLGATMPISIFSDLVSLFTLHIYSFYVASARIYNWQLAILLSLFHLFRGKKRNILRNRIDSCDYDMDQLLLGTILFTSNIFLLPTVFVFYLTFTAARIAAIALKTLLEIGLACLNHFPLFALMLRFKDQGRLPGGIYFEMMEKSGNDLKQKETTESHSTAYIHLKSVPLSLHAIFQSYFELGTRIRKHYLAPGVLVCLVTGQVVPPLSRRNLYSIQYSMLPASRATISELWTKLNDTEGEPLSATDGHSE